MTKKIEKNLINKLIKFITDNNLNFRTTDSSLNSVCCILCGYGLYLKANEEIIIASVDKSFTKVPRDKYIYEDELIRVFKFAEENNYATWWKSEEAKKLYKF